MLLWHVLHGARRGTTANEWAQQKTGRSCQVRSRAGEAIAQTQPACVGPCLGKLLCGPHFSSPLARNQLQGCPHWCRCQH